MLITVISALTSLALFGVQAAPTTTTATTAKNQARFPLTRNPNFTRNATAAILRTKAKYAAMLPGIFAEGVIPMTDYQYDIEYYGTVQVGTPGQSLKLDFDTGSSDLWFASTLCSGCSSNQTKYDPNKSSTYKEEGENWTITYGDGSSAGGVTGLETVSLGGLKVTNQRIEMAAHESSSFASGPADGLLGLAFDSLASVKGTKTPMTNLVEQGVISNPIFGVYLGKTSEGGGGEYIFGGSNSDHISGQLTTVPIDNSQGFWGVTIDSISVGSNSSGSSVKAIVDTGTTLLILNDSLADKIASYYNAKANGDGTYTISCDTSSLPALNINLNGANFSVPSDSLIYTKQGSSCIAGFGKADLNLNILGDVFIKNYYIIFNTKIPQIQIAPSK